MTLLKECGTFDVEALREMSIATYVETFDGICSDQNMHVYLNHAFSLETLKHEITNNSTKFYLLYSGKNVAGYIKMNQNEKQTDIHDPLSLEIERIYIKAAYQGNGYGQNLINLAVQEAMQLEKEYIWLGV